MRASCGMRLGGQLWFCDLPPPSQGIQTMHTRLEGWTGVLYVWGSSGFLYSWEWVGWGGTLLDLVLYSPFSQRPSLSVFNETALLDNPDLWTCLYLGWACIHTLYSEWTRTIYGLWGVGKEFTGKWKQLEAGRWWLWNWERSQCSEALGSIQLPQFLSLMLLTIELIAMVGFCGVGP